MHQVKDKMKNKGRDYLLVIEHYLEGRMTYSEEEAFERMLQEDEGLKNEFKAYILLYETLSVSATQQTLSEISQKYYELDQQGVINKPKISLIRRILICCNFFFNRLLR